jgi:hypothetical protein
LSAPAEVHRHQILHKVRRPITGLHEEEGGRNKERAVGRVEVMSPYALGKRGQVDLVESAI